MTETRDEFRRKAEDGAAAKRLLDRADLNLELAGLVTGRVRRFLLGDAALTPEARAKKARRDRIVYETALEMMLADPAYRARYEAFGKMLSLHETSAQQALDAALAELEAAEADLEVLQDKANTLPDGRRVYRTEDGRIVDENGQVIDDTDAAGIVWKDGAPSYQDYLMAKNRADAARQRADAIRRYQVDVLGPARNRWEDPDRPITPGEMDDWQRRIEDGPVGLQTEAVTEAAPTAAAPSDGISGVSKPIL
ncbi:MAG: hypothetical protein AAFU49_24210 [Pseudomonadota bacterium]